MDLTTLKVKIVDVDLGEPRIVLNPTDASKIGLISGSRARISKSDGTSTMAIVSLSRSADFMKEGHLGLFSDLIERFGVSEGELVKLEPARPASSIAAIRKKISGEKIGSDELRLLIENIYRGAVSNVELAAFVTALSFHGADMDEIEAMTRTMAEVGNTIDYGEALAVDKHGIGGVPGGSKDALLIVPIVSAAGLLIPKTSTRAIVSPSGTVDTMEVLAPVDLSADEIALVAKKVGGVIAWARSANLSPVDSILIEEVEHPLSLDPEALIYASIMSKKYAAGIKKMVLDIPTGPQAKVETKKDARRIARNMMMLGERLGIRVEAAISYGGQPIGYSVGPALEAREALTALLNRGEGAGSLVEKAVVLSAILLELGGVASVGKGPKMAGEILRSGKAYESMRKIIEGQGGDPNIQPEEIEVGSHRHIMKARMKGYITAVSNMAITRIARAAGAPKDKGAGIVLFGKRGNKVEVGDPLIEIYSGSGERLRTAQELAQVTEPVRVEGMILEVHREREINV